MNSEQITLALISLLFLLILSVALVGIAIFNERIEFTTDFKYMKLEDIIWSYLNEKLNSIVYCEEGNNIIVPLIEIDSYEISFEKNEKYRVTSIKNYLNLMENLNLVYVFLLFIYLIWVISSKLNITFYENFKDSIYVISRLSILIMIFITLIDIFIFLIKDVLIKAEKKEFMSMKKYKFQLNLKVIMIILNIIVSAYLK